MNEKIRKILKYLFYTVFILAFLFVTNELFFEFRLPGDGAEEEKEITMTEFRIVYPDEPTSLEPTLIDYITRHRLNNIYEPLAFPDRDLKMKPRLAVSWGLIDDYTWEFRLRPDVKFHDGSSLDVEDVRASLSRAVSYPDSELAGSLDTIEGIKEIDELTFRIVTTTPDPLLLQRMSLVFIVPSELKEDPLTRPVGTGSYKYSSWDKGNKITLERFDEYWGELSTFEMVEIYSRPDKFQRVDMILDGEADFLAFVPFDAVDIFEKRGLNIATIPNLEVQFLVFNFESDVMAELDARKAISLAIDPSKMVDAVGGFARVINQFISNGIFGYNPNIDDHEVDLEKAKLLAEDTIAGKTIQIHLLLGLDLLGEHIRERLTEIGAKPVISYLDLPELMESIESQAADIYFLGHKSELGDSSSFFNDVAHSEGEFNIGSYSNPRVDKLIDESSVEMDVEFRLSILQETMKMIVESDFLGVPILEYENVYGFSNDIDIIPRIDGFIYFDEIIVN